MRVSFRIAIAVLSVTWLAGTNAGAESRESQTTWRGLPAIHLTDGKSEAIVVPQLGGRLVHFGHLGGPNWIWTGEPGSELKPEALYWGGDKTYIGPHSMWSTVLGSAWPPPKPDSDPHVVLPSEPGSLATRSTDWPVYGGKVVRSYTFDEKGALQMSHSVAPVPGNSTVGAIWTITQIVPTDSVFVPLNGKSPYKDHFFTFGGQRPPEQLGILSLTPKLLVLRPPTGSGFKLAAHPKKPALAAVKDGFAFVQRAEVQKGQYPEGVDGAGFSVEVYHHNLPAPREYTELELLSPMRRMDQGLELRATWSLHAIPKSGAQEFVDGLLQQE